jgi:hypothetical protein
MLVFWLSEVYALSPRPVRLAYASRGVLHGQHSIKLYTFAYKFISNLYYSDEIASNNPPLYKSLLYRIRTLPQSVLPF